MKRLLPKSLVGQMAVLLGIALLVAQLANFGLILNERQKLSLARTEAPAIAAFARTVNDLGHAAPEFRQAVIDDASAQRGVRFKIDTASGIAEAERDSELEKQALAALSQTDAQVASVRAARGPAAGDKWRGRSDTQIVRLAATTADGQWIAGRLSTPKRDPLLGLRLITATLLLYVLVLGATIWIAARIARPLRQLTRAADRFRGKAAPVELVPSGPDDVARAMAAFNAMNRRMIALLDEKDHMLGAIGHDLRTPLASLRIRIEAMEPEEERAAAIAKIEEMTAMLEDILVLARSGRAREAARPTDISALTETLVDEYQDLGRPVTFAASPRAVAPVQADLLRRALRNLIDNAVSYGGDATLSVALVGETIEIRVADHGPGIALEHLERVRQPFQRLETSRNRATGGSGLGLAIATSIAESHGGSLDLSPAPGGGLIAVIRLPASGQ